MRTLDLDRSTFVRERTHVAAVPLLPEIRLRQATQAFMLTETTERDLASQGMALPFWAFPWPGGVALARYLLDHPALVEGRRVLDVGSGSGLVAIAAARAGAASVIANDVDPLALVAVELNARINRVTVQTLEADLFGEGNDAPLEAADLLLAADVAYESATAARIFPRLRRLAAAGVDVYVGDPGRAYLPTEDLERAATYEVAVDPALELATSKPVSVWRLDPERSAR